MVIKEFSSMGRHHLDTNGENQDVVCYDQKKDFSVISLADGVSSCKKAKCGAEIAGRAITSLLLKKGEYFFEFKEQQTAELVLSHILCELKKKAAEEAGEIEEYSSTVASVLFDKKHKRMLCFHLGDSIIVAAGRGQCRVLAMPSDSSSGCCVTTTKNAASMISVKVVDTSQFESVVICSDGAWREMFLKNKLRPEAAALLVNSEFDRLKEFLTGKDCFDDYSFIAMNLQQKRRKSA